MKLDVKIGRVKLELPVVCASGTFGFAEELKNLVDFSKIGAVITKTVTLDMREGNPPPRIFDTGCGVINAVGLENPGVKDFIEKKLPAMRKVSVKYIFSVGGFSVREYSDVISKVDKFKEIACYELNLSCPNLQLKRIVSQDPDAIYKLVRKVRKETNKPIIVKITPEVSDITETAYAAECAGADAVSLVNTFFAMAININTFRPVLGNVTGGYSGRAIKPMALYRVWKVYEKVKIPIIGGGGIENADDAVEFLLAGASIVSLGTVNLVHPNIANDIVAGIKSYMDKNNIKTLKRLIGKAHEK
ncbi:MAG: dihydroorotate dehydrogenase [Candidatus Omnitrophica bacterium]|nr:dihydroorotate dehydrogenase [Candidatus Omnitrophota bacterium]MDD5081279.1 dihydroorotate dehydrogenase [Candidatus Omnitrophota bacterium]MDD5441083.1 dihydroorotate dehydrogenase [Candidatus Omnitrophota bacterium]